MLTWLITILSLLFKSEKTQRGIDVSEELISCTQEQRSPVMTESDRAGLVKIFAKIEEQYQLSTLWIAKLPFFLGARYHGFEGNVIYTVCEIQEWRPHKKRPWYVTYLITFEIQDGTEKRRVMRTESEVALAKENINLIAMTLDEIRLHLNEALEKTPRESRDGFDNPYENELKVLRLSLGYRSPLYGTYKYTVDQYVKNRLFELERKKNFFDKHKDIFKNMQNGHLLKGDLTLLEETIRNLSEYELWLWDMIVKKIRT